MSSPSRSIHNITPAPKARGAFQKRGQKELKRHRIGELAVRACLLVMTEAIPVEPHQHNCINMGRTRVTTDMLKRKGKDHRELQATEECRDWEKQPSPGKSTPIGYPTQMVSSKNVHTQVTLYRPTD